MTTANPIDQLEPTILAWAEIVLKEFDTKMRLLKIHEGALMNSFEQHVQWHAGGDLHKIEFAFEYYGKFVDMGVGNGVTKDIRSTLISTGVTNRRPKPWFSDTFYKQLAVMRHLISERLAQNTQFFIVRNISDNADWHKERRY